MNIEELEKEDKLAKKLIEAIVAATERLRRTLMWERFANGIYGADWESTCKLLFIHKDISSDLYVVDKSGFRDPFIMMSVGESMHNLFGRLEIAIRIQISRYHRQYESVTTQKEYILNVIKKLSQ